MVEDQYGAAGDPFEPWSASDQSGGEFDSEFEDDELLLPLGGDLDFLDQLEREDEARWADISASLSQHVAWSPAAGQQAAPPAGGSATAQQHDGGGGAQLKTEADTTTPPSAPLAAGPVVARALSMGNDVRSRARAIAAEGTLGYPLTIALPFVMSLLEDEALPRRPDSLEDIQNDVRCLFREVRPLPGRRYSRDRDQPIDKWLMYGGTSVARERLPPGMQRADQPPQELIRRSGAYPHPPLPRVDAADLYIRSRMYTADTRDHSSSHPPDQIKCPPTGKLTRPSGRMQRFHRYEIGTCGKSGHKRIGQTDGVDPVLFHVLPDAAAGMGMETARGKPPMPARALAESIADEAHTELEDESSTESEGNVTPTPQEMLQAAAGGRQKPQPKRDIASIDFGALPPAGLKRFRVSLNQQRMMATAFSTMWTVAILQNEADIVQSTGGEISRRQLGDEQANVLGAYFNPEDDAILVGGYTLQRAGMRLVNLGHRHGFIYSMASLTAYNLLFVPLGGWLQRNLLEKWLGWDMYEFQMRRVGRGPSKASAPELSVWALNWTAQSFVRLYCGYSGLLIPLHFIIASFMTKGIGTKGGQEVHRESGAPLDFGWFRAFWVFTALRIFYLSATFDLVAAAFWLWGVVVPRVPVTITLPGWEVATAAVGWFSGEQQDDLSIAATPAAGNLDVDVAHGAPSSVPSLLSPPLCYLHACPVLLGLHASVYLPIYLSACLSAT